MPETLTIGNQPFLEGARMRLRTLASTLLVLALTARAPAIDPKYLPPHTEAAITVNLKAVLDSELAKNKKDLVQQLRTMILDKLAESPAKPYLDKAGFDVMRDLHAVTIATDGSKEDDSLFIAVEGNFNPDKIVSTARDAAGNEGDAIKVTQVGKATVFEIKKGENKTIYASLVSDSLLIAAPTREGLSATINRVNGGRAATVSPAMRSLLGTTNSKQAVSVVATGEGIAKGMEKAPGGLAKGGNLGFSAQDLDGFTLSVTVTRDITFQLGITTKDEDSAKKMAAAANFGLLTVRGMIAQKAQEDAKAQPVADIANTLRVTNQGLNVMVRGEVTQENFDRILALIPRR